LALIVIVIN